MLFFEISELELMVAGRPRGLLRGGRFQVLSAPVLCQLLKQARFRLNPEKCEIAQRLIDYLGHRIENGNIRPCPRNINGLVNTQTPKTADEACKFVKAAEYYRKFIPDFSIIAEPLRKFVPTTRTQARKGPKTAIVLNELEQLAFIQLKQILTNDLVLQIPDNNLPFKLQTDASDEGIGAVLLQIYPEGDRPIAYLSKNSHAHNENGAQWNKNATLLYAHYRNGTII